MYNKLNPSGILQVVAKSTIVILAAFWVVNTPLRQFFLVIFICFTPFFYGTIIEAEKFMPSVIMATVAK